MGRLLRSTLMLAVAFAAVAAQAAADRPVVRMPGLEQGSSVRGDVLIDVIMRPADDGTPLLKVDLAIDEVPLITIDLQAAMRNVTYPWATTDPQWGDGKHQIVAKVMDAKGREGVYRTFVYVWNQGRPSAANNAPASLEIKDTDGAPDNVITQKALIHVKVDPNLGAKWVMIYLNDKLLAMLNYPPYQAILDPAARGIEDGPVVVRAKVIHPDSTETNTEPMKLEVNMSGKYTPNMGPVGPTTPATTGLTPPVPGRPDLATTPRIPLPTETPGTAATSANVAATATGVPVGADRPSATRAMRPGVIDGGTVEMGALPGATAPAEAAMTAPPVPSVASAMGPKSAARTVMGPLRPARSAVGAASQGAAAASGRRPPTATATGAVPAVSSQPVNVRMASPRTNTGVPGAMRSPMAEPGLNSGLPRDASAVAQTPAGRRAEVVVASPATGPATGTTGTEGAVVLTPGRGPAATVPRTVPLPIGQVDGQPVTVPRRAGAQPAVTLPAVAGPSTPRVAPTTLKMGRVGRVHTVVKGDTVYALAKQYGCSVSAISRVNNLKNVHLIRIGQKLVVPGGKMQIDGQAVKTDVAPVQLRNGIATSPLRYVVEAMGGTVSWVGPAHQMVANTAGRGVITITVGSHEAQVNDEKVLMDLAAYLEQGRTMVPVRFISAALDVTIEMDDRSGDILIKSNR